MEILPLFLLLLPALCRADLPIDCRYSDAVGTWLVSEGNRTGTSSLDCAEVGPVSYRKQFTLDYPNLATDELGNTGTWELIYNQGFEVNINGRSYWASFQYNSTVFDCSKLHTGYSRDKTVRNWSCFSAVKAGTQGSFSHRRHQPSFSSAFLDRPYKNNAAFIARINEAQTLWRAKAYPEHEKFTNRQMIQRAGGSYKPLPHPAASSAVERIKSSMLPSSFDWRNVSGVNYVSPVRDQENCGSCYAFASTGMLEARLRIVTNNSRQDIFSEQDILSCSKISEGCAGGFSYLIAGRYAMEQGLVSESCSPYNGMTTECATDVTCGRTYVSEYGYTGGYYGASNEHNMMEALVSRGPISVDFMCDFSFYTYSEGIYVHPGVTTPGYDPVIETNHAVVLVGYGVHKGVKYWTVKNSWGTNWGENGYFRIKRGVNEKGIESSPFEATIIP